MINSENDSDKGIAATGRNAKLVAQKARKENLLAKDENSKFLQAILINLVRVSIRK